MGTDANEGKPRDYVFILKSVTCNSSGKYDLRLELKSSNNNVDPHQVNAERGSEVVDITSLPSLEFEVTQDNLEDQVPLSGGEFKFHFPKGIFKDDTELNLSFQLSKHSPQTTDDEVGTSITPTAYTANLSIHPRLETEEPSPPTGSINIYQTLEEENIQKLVGKLFYEEKWTVLDNEEEEEKDEREDMKEETDNEDEIVKETEPNEESIEGDDAPPLPLEEKEDGGKDEGAVSEDTSQTPLAVPKPESVFVDKKPVAETPVSEYLPDSATAWLGTIKIIIHAACLPKSPQNIQSRPFVKGFIRCMDSNGQACESHSQETRPSQNATLSPLWEQYITLTLNQDDATRAHLLLQLKDHVSLSNLAEFDLPISFMQPFHQYHIDMIQSTDGKGDVHLYTSILYQPADLPSQGGLTYRALEINVLSLDMEVANPVGPLTLVSCLCHDIYANKTKMEIQNVYPFQVDFPEPHPSSFLVSSDTLTSHSHCQISIPSESETRPNWHHQFLFANHRKLASIFTDTAALVIYLTASSSAFDGQSWCLKQQVGVVVQPLDRIVFEALTSPRGKAGVKVQGLKLQSSSLHGPDSKPLGMNLTLHLITDKNIESTISSSSPEFLPSLESFYHHEAVKAEHQIPLLLRRETKLENEAPTIPKTPPCVPLRYRYTPQARNGNKLPRVDDVPPLPSYHAMQNLLERAMVSDMKPADDTIPTRLPPENSQPRQHEELTDKFVQNLLESQQRELDNYRQALQRMGQEMVALQHTVSKLENENSSLRRQLNMHEDAAKALVTAENAEIMTKAELLDKFVTLKQSLSQQVEESTSYRDKVLALQNQLIKFNDKERTYIQQEKTLVTQKNLLQERNDKVKKLENTCRQQEMALENMEKIMQKKLSKSSSPLGNTISSNLFVDAVNAENSSLKAQLAHLQSDSKQKLTSNIAAENLMKDIQLEKAQARITSLENEIVDKAHEWGREKSAMRLTLSADSPSRYRALPPLGHPYDYPQRRVDDYPDLGYTSRRPPPPPRHSRLSPLF